MYFQDLISLLIKIIPHATLVLTMGQSLCFTHINSFTVHCKQEGSYYFSLQFTEKISSD